MENEYNMMGDKVEIFVATHKKINLQFPVYYKIIQVNSKQSGRWMGYLHDDENDNISEKNYCYCELTALYWMWKNSNANILGLFHYRRCLSMDTVSDEYIQIGTQKDGRLEEFSLEPVDFCRHGIRSKFIMDYLSKYDVILPYPMHPYPQKASEDLEKYCYKKDINILDTIIKEFYNEYYADFKIVMESTNISYCNMFITNRDVLNSYCTWLFDVLEKVEERTDIKKYDRQHKRIYGYLSEVLLNVYVMHNHLKCKYVNMIKLLEEESPSKSPVKYIRHLKLSCGFFVKKRLGLLKEKSYNYSYDEALRRCTETIKKGENGWQKK